jgi:hypothetical protein
MRDRAGWPYEQAALKRNIYILEHYLQRQVSLRNNKLFMY